ncbi:enoyl-CoA hydratase/carnithine racemase [Hoeflea sp. IMCC20628]|uniref:enoyl-CoA hydratase-related protein n=1 Tax=Hoeflea sp. IMCC20628 TaxID=1620421 RepID=UPI00063A9016|nr:enoyl-CoA hydratase-related protein [Hoeflea sp. IMCC20628]AKI00572.1 enoyl-CoA hydratase/carnithine racemase [Hoeflea sp. IMCC20628]
MDVNYSFAGGAITTAIGGDGIGRMIINRPEKLNALTDAMWRAIPGALDWLASMNHARVVIIEGAGGKDFSAGADIGEFETLRKDGSTARIYEKGNSDAFAAIRTCPVPVIAAVRGICFGGGFGIAAAADIRLADETARFAIPAARLGLAYPIDAVQDLVRALGDQKARWALFSAREMSASQALASGCLLTLSGPGQLEMEVFQLASDIAEAAPLSVRASKAAISAQASRLQQDFEQAEALGARTFESLDYAEGRCAFMEKRRAAFSGK